MVQQSGTKGQLPTHSFTIPPCASITWIRFNGYNLSPYLHADDTVSKGHPFKLTTKLDRICLRPHHLLKLSGPAVLAQSTELMYCVAVFRRFSWVPWITR